MPDIIVWAVRLNLQHTSCFQFLTLLRGIASTLEMDSIGGLRSIAHIPRDERSRLAGEREQAIEQLTSRIKVLKERIMRKDELLQGYERDLAKLRQAEILAEQKNSQVESLSVSQCLQLWISSWLF